MLVPQSCLTRCDPGIVACQVPLSLGFSRQKYWSRLPFSSPGDLPDLGIEPGSLAFPALAGGFCATRETPDMKVGLESTETGGKGTREPRWSSMGGPQQGTPGGQ